MGEEKTPGRERGQGRGGDRLGKEREVEGEAKRKKRGKERRRVDGEMEIGREGERGRRGAGLQLFQLKTELVMSSAYWTAVLLQLSAEN